MRRNRFGSFTGSPPVLILSATTVPTAMVFDICASWMARKKACVRVPPGLQLAGRVFRQAVREEALIWNVGSQWPIGKKNTDYFRSAIASSAVVVVNGSDETVQALQRVRGDTPLIARGSRRLSQLSTQWRRLERRGSLFAMGSHEMCFCGANEGVPLRRFSLWWGQRAFRQRPVVCWILPLRNFAPLGSQPATHGGLDSLGRDENEELGRGRAFHRFQIWFLPNSRKSRFRGERRFLVLVPVKDWKSLETHSYQPSLSTIVRFRVTRNGSSAWRGSPGCVPDCLSGGSAKSGSGVVTRWLPRSSALFIRCWGREGAP